MFSSLLLFSFSFLLKSLGGSSCLNYYTWVRGSKATFDDWAEYGGDSWNWDGCKEYFDKVYITSPSHLRNHETQ
jgi:choline dehydrogenase-like flavoprotein